MENKNKKLVQLCKKINDGAEEMAEFANNNMENPDRIKVLKVCGNIFSELMKVYMKLAIKNPELRPLIPIDLSAEIWEEYEEDYIKHKKDLKK